MVIPSKCSNQHKKVPLKKGCYSQSPSPIFKKYPNTQLKASATRFQWGPRICQDDIVNACPTKQKQPMKNPQKMEALKFMTRLEGHVVCWRWKPFIFEIYLKLELTRLSNKRPPNILKRWIVWHIENLVASIFWMVFRETQSCEFGVYHLFFPRDYASIILACYYSIYRKTRWWFQHSSPLNNYFVRSNAFPHGN